VPTEFFGAQSMTPVQVLKQFAQLRQEVLSVIDKGETIANAIPAVATAARAELDHARRLISDAHLSLVVVGGEGAGKSTLIRGILKQELSPIEHNQPGTVAPVYLMYGEGSPKFTIEFAQDGRAPEV